ncbi:MAG: PQQ-binding-like beta-propeller repeat protein [Bacteroidota bacterium]|nr:PQQ-binding-like beta-propeller repeat protein [Bacteroidota bacterium]
MRLTHFLLTLAAGLVLACNNTSDNSKSWKVTGGSKTNIKYSGLQEIDSSNVSKLQIAWVYHTEHNDSANFGPMECNPIIVSNILYGVSPKMKLYAIDAATGQEKWVFDPADSMTNKTWPVKSINMNRGVAYWEDADDRRVIFTAGNIVFELNALTGKLVLSFGKGGGLDLREGLGRKDVQDLFMAPTSPVMVYRNLFIVSGLVAENTPGHIRAFDVKTGEQKWIFHTIPYPGEPGFETWEDTSAYKFMGSTNAWPGFSLDEKRGILFAVTGNPSNDFYGGLRLGAGLFGNCILALDAASGRLIWYFQTVHHDVWDRDLPAAPALVSIFHEGKKIDAVAQTSKQGYIFVLDRETGKPIFPIVETPVPTDTRLAREKLWATQPVPVLPKPFIRESFTEADLNNLVDDSSFQDIKKRFGSYRSGPLFTPPSREGTIVFPGYDGGGEWGGPSFDPATGWLYVNANEMPWVLTMVENKPVAPVPHSNLEAGKALYMQNCSRCHGPERKGGGDYPSILGVEKKYNSAQFLQLLAGGKRMMPGFGYFNAEQKKALASFILNDKKQQDAVYTGTDLNKKDNDQPQDLYGFTGYNKFLTREEYPAVKPPWGTLNAINLNTGEYEWKIPFGEFPELKKKGIPETGRENYGGPVVTAGGLLFIGASSDGKFRAFNKRTGKLLWETDLPAPGVATPAVYSIQGKQYVVIACGGSKWKGGRQGDALVAFALPDDSR